MPNVLNKEDEPKSPDASIRVRAFDIVRGLAVISMVAFHFCYDLKYISGVSLPFFAGMFQNVWRCSISWTFIFIAGCMTRYSRNNLRRAGKYLLVALAIFVATTVVAVDTPISFGIIYCMGACTLVYALLERLEIAPRGIAVAVVLLALFFMTLHIARGYVSLPLGRIDLPQGVFDTSALAWLGIPGGDFASGDYYPLLPYLFLFLAASSVVRTSQYENVAPTLAKLAFRPLELVGRHALLIYVLHQPILLVMAGLIAG